MQASAAVGRASEIRAPASLATEAAHGSVVGPILGFLAAGTLALCLALMAPLAVTVGGLLLFGVLHNYFELRYVIGRYALDLPRGLLLIAGVLISLIVLRRLILLDRWGELTEILLAYLLILATLWWATRHRPVLCAVGVLGVTGAGALSVSDPALHFVALSHLHNLVPLAFLWWWSASIRVNGVRVAFRTTQVLWALGVPLAIIGGVLDGILPMNRSLGSVFAGDMPAFASSYTPAAWLDDRMPLRVLTAFAFLQTMHYVVWCGFFPLVDRAAPARLDHALQARRLPAGPWLMCITLACAALIGVLMSLDYFRGRSLYAALASYHAYIEFPILLFGLLAIGQRERVFSRGAARPLAS